MDVRGKALEGIADRLVERRLSTADLATPVSVMDTVTLVKYHTSNWYHLGLSLSIDSSKLDTLRIDMHSETDRKLKVFQLWQKGCEEAATYEKLVIALYRMDKNNPEIKDILSFLAQKLDVDIETRPTEEIEGISREEDTDAHHEASSRSDTSEYQSQPPFPEFVCGCQKCSINDYLHTGCPLAGKVENYPKLDIKGLSLDDQEILLNRLDKETQKVQRQFASLLLYVAKSIAKRHSVDELALFVGSFNVFKATRAQDDKRLLRQAIDDINATKSIAEMFKILNKFWSWLNYGLLVEIIDEFGSEGDKRKLRDYENQTLIPFLQRSIIQIPSTAYGHLEIPNYRKLIFKLGTAMESHIGDELRIIHQKLADILNVEYTALHLSCVKDGCLELTFLVPDIVLEVLFPLSREMQLNLAGFVHGDGQIEQVSCGDYIYNLEVTPEMKSIFITEPAFVQVNSDDKLTMSSVRKNVSESLSISKDLIWLPSPTINEEETESFIENPPNIVPYYHPFVRMDSGGFSNDDDEESCSTSHNTKKWSKIATSPSVTGSHQDSAYLTCSEKASVGASSISNQPSPTSHRKPYKGVKSVCETCWETNKRERMLAEFQCMETENHENLPYVFVTWNDSMQELQKIRDTPTFDPHKFILCSKYQSSCKQNCTYAHSEVELRAWNFELSKRRQMRYFKVKTPYNLTLSGDNYGLAKLHSDALPGKHRLPSQMQTRYWKTNFLQRMKRTNLNEKRQQLEIPLNSKNYKHHFYDLLCFEEMEHIDALTKKCDGSYKLHIFEETPKFLQNVSEGRRRNTLVHGYLFGECLTNDQIEYATQASEAVYIVSYLPHKTDICKAIIHGYNFKRTEEKLYISLSEDSFQKVKQCCTIEDKYYIVDAEFEVKHSYFNNLHSSVINLPYSMIDNIVPTSALEFQPFVSEEKPLLSDFNYLCLSSNHQLPVLQAIVSSVSTTPFLLSGPFGSGKTRILACAAYHFAMKSVIEQKPAKILICAHHQESTETFIHAYFGRMQHDLQSIGKTLPFQVVHIVRGKSSRIGKFAAFYKTVAEFDEKYQIGTYSTMKPIIIIATYMTSLSLYGILQTPGRGFFTHILLDEAAQVREPEAVSPLSLATQDARIVLAGDNLQVGPKTLVLGQEATQYGLNLSLLERLLKLYQSFIPASKPYYAKLIVNYRSHKSLLSLPAKLFYEELVIEDYPFLQKFQKGPHGYSFVCSDSLLVPTQSHLQKFEVEAAVLLEEVLSYLQIMKREDPYLNLRRICIISSTRNQLNNIKKLVFNNDRYAALKSATFLPSFMIQGHEFKAIFLSLFGSLSDGKLFHDTKSLCNPLVFNTVITRARTRVVAVGDPLQLLMYESANSAEVKQLPWHEYLKLCLEQNSLQTCRPDVEIEIRDMLRLPETKPYTKLTTAQQPGRSQSLEPFQVAATSETSPQFKRFTSVPAHEISDSSNQHSLRKCLASFLAIPLEKISLENITSKSSKRSHSKGKAERKTSDKAYDKKCILNKSTQESSVVNWKMPPPSHMQEESVQSKSYADIVKEKHF